MKSNKSTKAKPSDSDKAMAQVGSATPANKSPQKQKSISEDVVTAEKDEVKKAEEKLIRRKNTLNKEENE